MRKNVLSLSIERALPEVLRIAPGHGEPIYLGGMTHSSLPLKEAARSAEHERVMAELEKVFGRAEQADPPPRDGGAA